MAFMVSALITVALRFWVGGFMLMIILRLVLALFVVQVWLLPAC